MQTHTYCDLILKCQDEEFYVHKIIVCTQSEVLKSMAEVQPKIVNDDGIQILELPDEASKLSRIVNFMYTRHFDEWSTTEVISEKNENIRIAQMYTVAKAYGIKEFGDILMIQLGYPFSDCWPESGRREFLEAVPTIHRMAKRSDETVELYNFLLEKLSTHFHQLITTEETRLQLKQVLTAVPDLKHLIMDKLMEPNAKFDCPKCGRESSPQEQRCSSCFDVMQRVQKLYADARKNQVQDPIVANEKAQNSEEITASLPLLQTQPENEY